MTTPFTGIYETDFNILSYLRHKDRVEIGSVNRYLSNLCQNPNLWKFCVKKHFSDAIEFKSEDETWKKYDYILSNLELNQEGANWAADNGYLSALRYLGSLNIYPCDNGVNKATYNGHLNVLKWYNSMFSDKVIPYIQAIEGNQYETLVWLIDIQHRKISEISNNDCIEMVHHGRDNMIEWVVDNKTIYNFNIHIRSLYIEAVKTMQSKTATIISSRYSQELRVIEQTCKFIGYTCKVLLYGFVATKFYLHFKK